MDVSGLDAALSAIVAAADNAGKRIVTRSQVAFEAGLKTALSAQAHQRGTPTNSPPGGVPSKVSGTLARSVLSESPTASGPGLWSGRSGPTTVYSRIQELGGQTGRGHATTLPARPYVKPTQDALGEKFSAIQAEEFGAALNI